MKKKYIRHYYYQELKKYFNNYDRIMMYVVIHVLLYADIN